MEKMKTPDAKSPVETNQPFAQHVVVPTWILSCDRYTEVRAKAIACWMSAKTRLYMRSKN